MANEFAFDEREWMRDELLIAADEWAEIMAGAEARQAMEIREMLTDLLHLKSSKRISQDDRFALARVMDQLTAQLRRLRR